MKPGLHLSPFPSPTQFCVFHRTNLLLYQTRKNNSFPISLNSISLSTNPFPRFFPIYCVPQKSSSSSSFTDQSQTNKLEENLYENGQELQSDWKVQIGNPNVPSYVSSLARLSLSDQAFFLLSFIACTTSVAFTSLVIAAVPTLYAMGRAAISLSKLADTAREELPSTMAAIRLSGMEISDLTLELSDLSQEITDGVNKSAQAMQAAEAGIRRIGSLAHHQTMSMIQERASLPMISIQPVVAGAAKKTSRAVGHATKTFMSIISRGEVSSGEEGANTVDRVEM